MNRRNYLGFFVLSVLFICLLFAGTSLSNVDQYWSWKGIEYPLIPYNKKQFSQSDPVVIMVEISSSYLEKNKYLPLIFDISEDPHLKPIVKVNDNIWAVYNIKKERPVRIKKKHLKSGNNKLAITDKQGYGIATLYSIRLDTKSVILPKEPPSLSISSNPYGADIFLDGEHIGVTPQSIITPRGEYRLELKKEGYHSLEEQISVYEDDKKLQFELKLVTISTSSSVLKRQLTEEKTKREQLNRKLAQITEEKANLEEKLETAIDIKMELETALEQKEKAYQEQQDVVAALYEKERQLKSKLFQLELTAKRTEENQIALNDMTRRAEELRRQLGKKEKKNISENLRLEKDLNSVLLEKVRLETVSVELRQKEVGLKNEVTSLKQIAERTRLKSESAKKKLTMMKDRESALISQIENLKERIDRGMAPVVVISHPKNQLKIDLPTTMVHFIAVDDKGIEDVNLFLDGKNVKLDASRGIIRDVKSKGIKSKGNASQKIDLKQRLQLEYGSNTIKVVVKDIDGMVTEELVNVIREKEKGNIWAVVIGINEYLHVRNLKYAVNDASGIKSYLREYLGLPEENIFYLTDRQATKTRILSLLGTQIRRKASQEDTVIIFYAGHGAAETDPIDHDMDGLEKYLLPHEARLDDLFSTAISMNDITTIFQRIRSDRIYFIADTCYSGASGGRTILASGTRATLSDKFLERISRGKGRVIITASSANEVSKEDDKLKHGIFTYYFLKGLKGEADFDNDGIISISEIFSYLSRKVPDATGQDQHPVRKGETEGHLVIGRTK